MKCQYCGGDDELRVTWRGLAGLALQSIGAGAVVWVLLSGAVSLAEWLSAR